MYCIERELKGVEHLEASGGRNVIRYSVSLHALVARLHIGG